MIDGLWTVEFISRTNRYGKRVLVFEKGRLLGGDDGYYYSGNYHVNDSKINGDVNMIRYEPGYMTVFGDNENYSMTFSGNLDEDCYQFEDIGKADNHLNVKITGFKKVEL